jgi:pimeloyl-ACP methyl ester carboxylesterase
MTKDIVMLHGANEGAWCFDKFKAVFEGLGWTCHAPDLIGHGTKAANAGKTLVGIGMADYRAELEAFLQTVPTQPVLLGHSMGAVLAQLPATSGLARAPDPGSACAALRHPAAGPKAKKARPGPDGTWAVLEDRDQPGF